MGETTIKNETIDAYISSYDEVVQPILKELRRVIKEEAPDATEKISYQMGTWCILLCRKIISVSIRHQAALRLSKKN